MKKFFTLIAMALIAISANAKEVLTLPEDMGPGKTTVFGSWQWRDVTLLFTGAEIADDATDEGVVYYDASAYDYLVIKYKECSANTNFGIQYNSKGTVGQWGAELYGSQTVLAANTSGVVGVELDADHKNKVYKVYLQPQGEGSLIVEEVYLGSKAEYEADAKATPIEKWVPATKELPIANATGGWGSKDFDATTGKCSLSGDGGAGGWWLTGDFSDYDYLVFEIEDLVKGGWGKFVVFGNDVDFAFEGSFVQVVDITGMERTNSNGSNLVLQGGGGTSWTWKKAYFATKTYVEENGIKTEAIYGDTQEIPLSGLNPWAGEGDEKKATFDASTGVLTITGDPDGGAGWWKGSADFSHFDNFVIQFDPATTAGGTVAVQYVDTEEASSIEFYPGATCVVVPLNAEKKATVQQLWIKGAKDASFTLTAAFVAVASATPAAALGTAPVEEVTWTVTGAKPLVEKSWDPSDASADMTSGDGVTYTYVKNDVTLEKGVKYEFKVVKNHAWGEEYPSQNYVLTVEETAKYKVTITFDSNTKEVSANYEKTGEAEATEHVWSVVGTINGEGGWDIDTPMTKGDDGIYTAVYTNVAAGTYKFKVRADGAWDIAYPSSDYELTVEQDNSTVTITFNPETNDVNATVSAAAKDLKFDLSGDTEIDVADLQKLINIIVGTDIVDPGVGDFNGDGIVDIADLQLLINEIVK